MIPGHGLCSVDPGHTQMTPSESEEGAVTGPRKDVMLVYSVVPPPPCLTQRSFKSASVHLTASGSKWPWGVEVEEVTDYQ